MTAATKLTPVVLTEEKVQDSSTGSDRSKLGEADPPRHILKRPIVATSRKNVITMMQQVMEELGVKGGLSHVTTVREALEVLRDQPQSFLFVDWQLGPDVAVQILKAGRDGEALNLRPVLLLIPNVTAESAATAMEYCVSKVVAGQLTAPGLLEQVEQIRKIQEGDSIINQQLQRLADARRLGDKDLAGEMITTLHELHPNDLRITVEFTEHLIQEERWLQAEKLLQPLCVRDVPYLRALSAYSRCLLKRGARMEAEAVLKKAKLINPFDVERLIELGNVLLINEKVSEAHQNYSDAMKLDRANQEARVGKATCNLLQDEINSALTLLQEKTSPRELASIFNTAAIMASRGDKFEHAVKLYETATRLVEANPWLIARLAYNQGLAFNKWNKPEAARKMFEKAAKADPQFKKAVKHGLSIAPAVSESKTDEMEGAEETIFVGTQERRDNIGPRVSDCESEPKSMMDEIEDFGLDSSTLSSDDE